MQYKRCLQNMAERNSFYGAESRNVEEYGILETLSDFVTLWFNGDTENILYHNVSYFLKDIF